MAYVTLIDYFRIFYLKYILIMSCVTILYACIIIVVSCAEVDRVVLLSVAAINPQLKPPSPFDFEQLQHSTIILMHLDLSKSLSEMERLNVD